MNPAPSPLDPKEAPELKACQHSNARFAQSASGNESWFHCPDCGGDFDSIPATENIPSASVAATPPVAPAGTPRTDLAAYWPGCAQCSDAGILVVPVEIARQLETELIESERVQNGYLENVGSCGACAEGICCGSTTHEHEGCMIALLKAKLLTTATALESAQREIAELRKLAQELVNETKDAANSELSWETGKPDDTKVELRFTLGEIRRLDSARKALLAALPPTT